MQIHSVDPRGSTVIREQPAQLIRDREIGRQESTCQRQRSAKERAEAEQLIDRIRQKSDPLEK
jgi:hypothetical protein